jgi:hypothetical protein
LKNPLLTEEATQEIEALSYAPLDPEGRNFKNLYELICGNGIKEICEEGKFGEFFAPFNKLIDNERRYAKSGK